MLCVSSFFLLLLIEKIMFISSASAGCVWKTKWKIEPELETFANCEARQNLEKLTYDMLIWQQMNLFDRD